MAFDVLGLALLAGLLSTLSPCVLPLLPIVLGAALTEHKLGPVALALGLAISFVVIGMFFATIGFGIAGGALAFRKLAAVLILLAGFVLMMPRLQAAVAAAASPVSQWSENRFGGFETGGLRGQFALGLLLGAVWSPCVGPTLGAASVLASTGKNLGQVALTMTSFGIGAALPLLVLGTLSREAMLAWRGKLMSAGGSAKVFLGAALVLIGFSILTGLDKTIETALVEGSPEWLTNLTTRY